MSYVESIARFIDAWRYESPPINGQCETPPPCELADVLERPEVCAYIVGSWCIILTLIVCMHLSRNSRKIVVHVHRQPLNTPRFCRGKRIQKYHDEIAKLQLEIAKLQGRNQQQWQDHDLFMGLMYQHCQRHQHQVALLQQQLLDCLLVTETKSNYPKHPPKLIMRGCVPVHVKGG